MPIEIRDLRVRYRRHRALEGASFDIPSGRVTGFLGHNGAGKTTTLRAILGFAKPDAGTIRVDGFDPSTHRMEVLARVGALIEQCRFHEGWSGRRNLIELGRLAGLSRSEARAAAGERLEQVGLAQAAERAAGGYSQGMRQRLGIAQALLASPRHVLLDEPTNGLDPDGIAEIRDLLADLAQREGRAVLLSSHQLGEVTQLVDRIVVLREGVVVAEGDRRNLLADPNRRYLIRSPEGQRLREALERDSFGLRASDSEPGEFEVEMADRDPTECLARWVRAGLPIESFTPRPVTLEEFYLHAKSGALDASKASAPDSVPAEVVPPQTKKALRESLAPGGGLRRVLRHDTSRLRRSVAIFAAPLVVAGIGLWRSLAGEAETAAELGAGTLISGTETTAFVLVTEGLQRALPMLAVISVGFGSQLLAAEYGRGTLRNLVARPLGRESIALAKFMLAIAAAWAGFLLLAVVLTGVAGGVSEFGDLTELLPNGAQFPLLSSAESWPVFRQALTSVLLPLASAAAVGFACGSLLRSAAGALSLALGVWLGLDLARGFLVPLGWDAYLPTTYSPSFLDDRSPLDVAAIFLDGATNVTFAHEGAGAWVPPIVWVPTAWIAGCLLIGFLRFRARRFS